jgi:tol-pal system protein YbgF
MSFIGRSLPLAFAAALAALPVAAPGQQPSAQNRSVIELMNQIETLNAELNKLRGDLEVLNHSLENAQRRQRDMYLDLDTRLRRFEGAGGDAAQKQDKQLGDLDARLKRLEEAAKADAELDARLRRLEPQSGTPAPNAPAAAPAPPSPPAGTAAAPTVTPPSPPAAPAAPSVQRPSTPAAADASPRRAYDSALNIYRAGDYQGAIAAFDAFVKRYPRDALAPNAQYWIGDAWFNLRDFRAAASAQQALISNYPDSVKVPDAMLNLSSAQIALGESAAARKTLEDLAARYPQSDAAEKARQRLAKLR